MIIRDHFPLPFMDQLLEIIYEHPFYCFLDGYSSYFQIEISAEDQEKTNFTCPFGTYAYRRMSRHSSLCRNITSSYSVSTEFSMLQ